MKTGPQRKRILQATYPRAILTASTLRILKSSPSRRSRKLGTSRKRNPRAGTLPPRMLPTDHANRSKRHPRARPKINNPPSNTLPKTTTEQNDFLGPKHREPSCAGPLTSCSQCVRAPKARPQHRIEGIKRKPSGEQDKNPRTETGENSIKRGMRGPQGKRKKRTGKPLHEREEQRYLGVVRTD